jgi:hypothetical protein
LTRANAGFLADQVQRHIHKPGFSLPPRPPLPQHDVRRRSWPTTWNEFLPVSDHGDFAVEVH